MTRPDRALRLEPVGICETAAALLIGVSPPTFSGLVRKGLMPAPKRIGRRKIWDREAVVAAFRALPTERGGDAVAVAVASDNPWDEVLR